jgi:hypothetical protein
MGIFVTPESHILRTKITTEVEMCLIYYEEQLLINESVVNILQHSVAKLKP